MQSNKLYWASGGLGAMLYLRLEDLGVEISHV
jgi:hypothetical protein